MSGPDRSRVIRLADARARIPGPAGEHAVSLLDRGALKVKLSCPVRPNQQTPHTSTEQLAELAGKAKPQLLVLYHHSIALRPGIAASASTPGELLREMSVRYSGHFVIGRDLDVY